MMSQLIRAHIFVSGKVQGVFYRGATKAMAEDLGLQGWVRNLPDRRVEAVFEGSPEAVATMIDWCHQGPPAARVQAVAVAYEPPEGLAQFEIRY